MEDGGTGLHLDRLKQKLRNKQPSKSLGSTFSLRMEKGKSLFVSSSEINIFRILAFSTSVEAFLL